MEARDILVRPLITERTTQLMAEGKYVFVVAKAANKIEIAKAVSEIFKVKVAKVNHPALPHHPQAPPATPKKPIKNSAKVAISFNTTRPYTTQELKPP